MLGWDEEDEERAWLKNHRNSLARGDWQVIVVDLEAKRGHVKLNRDEWRQLQKFYRLYDISENPRLTRQQYQHLPKKVIIVIEDWLKHVAKGEATN